MQIQIIQFSSVVVAYGQIISVIQLSQQAGFTHEILTFWFPLTEGRLLRVCILCMRISTSFVSFLHKISRTQVRGCDDLNQKSSNGTHVYFTTFKPFGSMHSEKGTQFIKAIIVTTGDSLKQQQRFFVTCSVGGLWDNVVSSRQR